MRKYQQLLLVLISLASISVLLMYKSENNRLKYVLQVVNFFGRSDAAILERLENGTKNENLHDFSLLPIPVWQYIGDDFHAYSSFWNENELVAGGESISIVVSRKDAVINFKCGIRYKGGKIINGKFGFIRVETGKNLNKITKNDNFSIYKFLCKISREFGKSESLILTDLKTKTDHELLVRHIKNKESKNKSKLTVCVNLIPYNSTQSIEFLEKSNLKQFFLYHHAIGIDEFLIYNADQLPINIRKFLQKTGLQLHYFPYNFPYNYKTPQTRSIIEIDCLLRNTNAATATIIVEPNEYFFTNANLQFPGSILEGLKHHDNVVTRFEIPNYSVCLDRNNKLLMDNTLYDPNSKTDHQLYLYKPHAQTEIGISVPLPNRQCFSHTYINCVSSKDLVYWRNTIQEEFLQFIETIRNEISFLF